MSHDEKKESMLTVLELDNEDRLSLKITIGNNDAIFSNLQIVIKRCVNQHTVADVSGYVKHESYEEVVSTADPGSSIRIEYGLEGNELMLFYGLISYIDVIPDLSEHKSSYKIRITGMSYTYMLDQDKVNRAFSALGIEPRDVISYLLGKYEGSNWIVAPGLSGTKLDSFTLQYQETDWEFLQRLASREGAVITASSITPGAKFKFGVVWNEIPYILPEFYKRKIKEVKCIQESEVHSVSGNARSYHYCELITEGPDAQSLQVGDSVETDGRIWYVQEATACIKDFVLYHKYILVNKKGFWTEQKYNSSIKGSSLTGTVQAVNGNLVKIRMDIEEYPGENEVWFPYSTFYSTFYCMPEVGDRVNLYFPDEEESHGIVLNSIRAPLKNSNGMGKNFDTQAMFENNNVKILATKAGRMLILDDNTGKVSLVCDDGSFISISGNEISITTKSEIVLHAVGKISLSAGESIDLSAETEVKLTCKESSISIKEAQIDMNAVDIKMNEG